MLVQPGEGRLGEAVHAGCGDHAIEGLKEGPDDDAELMAADLRTKLAKAMVTHPVAVGSRTVEQICWFFSSYCWVTDGCHPGHAVGGLCKPCPGWGCQKWLFRHETTLPEQIKEPASTVCSEVPRSRV